MSINTTPTVPVTLNGGPLEFVEDFTYLGSLISNDNEAQKYIKEDWEKACCAFAKLPNIWKSIKTKLKLDKSNVKSMDG